MQTENLRALDKDQSMYVTAIEEGVELSIELMALTHAMIKGLRFGLTDKGPNSFVRNREKISAETNDLIAMLFALHGRGLIDINENAINAKLVKVEQYLQYARERQALDETDGSRFRKLVAKLKEDGVDFDMSLEQDDYLEAVRHYIDKL